ncbi:MAG: T9SS type A sorting domain-containing protein [Bacteroidales bacterium]|nr:T9SS type A sorting domain-containing protein [Bacteroidales bacterium]
MKRIILTSFITFLLLGFLAAQNPERNGAYYCAHKKQMSPSATKSFRSINSPKHRFDVLKYTMNIDLINQFDSPYPQDYDADVVVLFKVDSVLSSIKLDAVNTSLSINSVGMAGVSFTHQNDTLSITLDQTYQPGDSVEVSIDYEHLDVEDNAFYVSGGFVFTDCEPEGARKWFPCYDKPSDKASLDLTATVPSTVRLGSNGYLSDSTVSGNSLTYHWVSNNPIPTYLMVISARKNYNLDIVYWERPSDSVMVPFRFYYNNGEDPTYIESIIPGMCDYFSVAYGEHPFDKNGFATLNSEFAWGGMENQTLTSLCPGCWGENLVSHEFAHQWFGDMISPGTWADLWLNEGFATWSEAYWYEASGGYSAYKNDIENNASNYISGNPGWPIYNPAWIEETPPNGILFNYAITYAKSSCVIHQFRYIVGDSLFFKAIKGYATDTAEFKFKSAVTQDFVDKMSDEVGEDMHWYFDPWLEQPDHPVYENEYWFNQQDADTWKVHFVANQVQGEPEFFPMELNIFIAFDDLSDTTFRFRNMENNEEFVFDVEKEPVYLAFDLNNEIVLKQASLTVSTDEFTETEKSALFSNTPNPAQNQTTIRYHLSQNAWATLVLYDLSGRKIKTVFEGQNDKGTHQIQLETAALDAGVYLYSLKTTDGTFVKKMVVQH